MLSETHHQPFYSDFHAVPDDIFFDLIIYDLSLLIVILQTFLLISQEICAEK